MKKIASLLILAFLFFYFPHVYAQTVPPTPTDLTSLNLEQLIGQAVQIQPSHHNNEETKTKLTQFFRQRLSAILEERAFKVDEIEAILEMGIGILPDSLARLKSLQDVRSKEQFKSLAASHKRVKNILRQSTPSRRRSSRSSSPLPDSARC